MKRKVAVFTGSRSEYDLLKPLMAEIKGDASVDLYVIVSGSHLSPYSGNTWENIANDGFDIKSKVPMLLASDDEVSIIKSMGLGLIGLADKLKDLKPDLVVVLGDRYESFICAQACMVLKIPIAHIHGGETTEGAIDEAIRHSITKMSHLHFVAADEYKDRVLQMGENPNNVWVVGAAGFDNLSYETQISREEMSAILNLKLKSPLFVLTYHPVTLKDEKSGADLERLLSVMDEFNGSIVITGVNADTNATLYYKLLRQFADTRPSKCVLVETLGAKKYINLMAISDIVIGNSSSGLIEAPALGVPSVDVGSRQAGRLKSKSVIQTDNNSESEIRDAIKRGLSEEHKNLSKKKITPYGRPGAAKKILKIIKNFPLDNIIIKNFYAYPAIDKKN